MADFLSKEEVDALLKGESAQVDMEGKVVRPYDFHTPERLSKEHMRVFQILIEDFCHRLKKQLSSQLRLDIDMSVVSIKQSIFKDFLALPTPTYIATFTMQPLEGTAVIMLDVGFLIFLMEQQLGAETKEKPQARELTHIETETSTVFANRILTSFRDSFEKTIQFTPKVDAVDFNPQFVMVASPNEAALFITLEVKLREVSGTVVICLPYLILESFIPYLDLKQWFMHAQKKSVSEMEDIVKTHLGNTKLNLICKLGTCEISLRDLLRLQVGDCIRLDKPKESMLDLQVAGLDKFSVQPGLSGKRIAIKIASVLDQR